MVIGITGGIASGKTTVTSLIKEMGYNVIDCDVLAHDIFYKDDVQEKIREDIIDVRGIIERNTVSEIVFNNKDKMHKLNNIMQPIILEELKKEIAKYDLCFVDCPLLYEEHLEYLFDSIILVYASETLQIKRMIKRNGISKEDAIKRLHFQMPILDKLKYATNNYHYVIYNNVNLQSLNKELKTVLDSIFKKGQVR